MRINLYNLRSGEAYGTVLIGASRGQYGIDPFSVDVASGGSSASLCMADAYPDDMYHMLRLACETQSPSRVVYELGPSYWTNEQRSGSTQVFFYQEFLVSKSKFFYSLDEIINLDFRSALVLWSYYRSLIGQVPNHICRKQSTAYKDYNPSVLEIPGDHYADQGFICRGRIAGRDKSTFDSTPRDGSQVKSRAELYFNRVAVLCRKNGIELTAITTPVPQEIPDRFTGSHDQSHLHFRKLLEGLGLEYYNFNYMKPEPMDHSVEGYWGYNDHIDGVKAQEFSTLLGSFLNSLDQGSLTHSDYFIN